MLPLGAIIKKHFQRAKNIAFLLKKANYDVMVFQEVFHKKIFRYWKDQFAENYPYQAYIPITSRFSFKTSSGIVIYSKHPILEKKYIEYKNFCPCYAADCYAYKGALLIKIQKKMQQFQIVGTHLQAQEHPKAHAIRKCQLQAIFEHLIMPNLEKGVPQIIIGDLNVARIQNPQLYKEMLSILEAIDVNRAINPAFTYDGLRNTLPSGRNKVFTDILDYILFRSNNSLVKPGNYKVNYFRDPNNKDLSDHYAIEATFYF